jgi:hypothetical protein
MFSDRLLRQAFEYRLLFVTEILNPFVHVSKHHGLDLGLSIIKVWMESVCLRQHY